MVVCILTVQRGSCMGVKWVLHGRYVGASPPSALIQASCMAGQARVEAANRVVVPRLEPLRVGQRASQRLYGPREGVGSCWVQVALRDNIVTLVN